MSEELKPCPFCGGDKLYIQPASYESGRWAEIRCVDCNGGITSRMCGSVEEAKQEAIEAWNRRVNNE